MAPGPEAAADNRNELGRSSASRRVITVMPLHARPSSRNSSAPDLPAHAAIASQTPCSRHTAAFLRARTLVAAAQAERRNPSTSSEKARELQARLTQPFGPSDIHLRLAYWACAQPHAPASHLRRDARRRTGLCEGDAPPRGLALPAAEVPHSLDAALQFQRHKLVAPPSLPASPMRRTTQYQSLAGISRELSPPPSINGISHDTWSWPAHPRACVATSRSPRPVLQDRRLRVRALRPLHRCLNPDPATSRFGSMVPSYRFTEYGLDSHHRRACSVSFGPPPLGLPAVRAA